jgi:VWFA-related protein
MGSKPLIPIILIILMAFSLSMGQTLTQMPRTTIRAEVSLVNVVFTAKDKKGKAVEGLKADDFEIFENKQSQKIDYFSDANAGKDAPLTIALLIDTSSSVKKMLEDEKATAAEFFNEILRPNKDLAAIIQFDSDVVLLQDFTQNQDDLLNALNRIKVGNRTSLYDAIYLAAEEKLKSEIGRKIMVVITDGGDFASKLRKEEALDSAQRNDVIIYGIGVRDKNENEADLEVLRKFARETGGAYFDPHAKFSEIREAFRAIKMEIQGQYSLAYTPSNKVKDGTFRAIEIRCKAPGVRIRARQGYYAPKAK